MSVGIGTAKVENHIPATLSPQMRGAIAGVLVSWAVFLWSWLATVQMPEAIELLSISSYGDLAAATSVSFVLFWYGCVLALMWLLPLFLLFGACWIWPKKKG